MPILGKFNRAFLETDAKKPVWPSRWSAPAARWQSTTPSSTAPRRCAEADSYYMDRLVKTMLWMKGGFKVYVSGDEDIYATI